jgi:3-isopropylmalate dehydrogenase
LNAKTPLRIAVIGGDGTGPEVAAEGLKVLAAVAKLDGFAYETVDFDFGGARYLRTGETLPKGAVDELRTFDAIFLGAVGHPDVAPGILEKGLLRNCASSSTSTSTFGPSNFSPASKLPSLAKVPTISTLLSCAKTPKTSTAASAAS